jgi:hypothetical protein
LLVGDGIRRTWVEGLARDAGLADAVVFTGFRSDVAALLGVMDCFALASTRTEGVPQSLLQAFAAGVPVVASDVGGVGEVVVDGATGVLVKAEAADLAAGIERVLSDPAGAACRAVAARALVEERFSHASMLTRLLDLYVEVLAPAASARGPPHDGGRAVVLQLAANRGGRGSAWVVQLSRVCGREAIVCRPHHHGRSILEKSVSRAAAVDGLRSPRLGVPFGCSPTSSGSGAS